MKPVSMAVVVGLLAAVSASAWASDNLVLGGYLEASPSFTRLPEPGPGGRQSYRDLQLQSRVTLDWYASAELSVKAEARTRVFTGDQVRYNPAFAEQVDTNPGYLDLSWRVVDERDWLVHTVPDRLYAEWRPDDWSVRLGRQRVNWGINTVTNPNDLFNLYSFYDLSYPERPGADALRVQRYTGFASRWEVAASPGRESDEDVVAALYAFNARGYDIQLIGGLYRTRPAAGGGWAGYIRDAGFKGEVTLFAEGDSESSTSEGTDLVAAVSGEYMFANGLFLVSELLYNQAGGAGTLDEQALPSADNPSLARWQQTTQIQYSVNPLLSTQLASVWYPEESAVFALPAVTYSVASSLDWQTQGRFFVGSGDNDLSGAGNQLVTSLKWNF